MRASLVLASLTLKEMVRRRTFLASVVIVVLFFALSFLPTIIQQQGPEDPDPARQRILAAFLTTSGIDMIKFFASVLAITFAAGAISGEIERGVLHVIFPKPLRRSNLLVGKWLGITLFLFVNVVVWTLLLWVSIRLQFGGPRTEILRSIGPVMLYPVLFTTLTLTFSTFATQGLASGLALIAAGIAWSESVLGTFSMVLNIAVLETLARIAGYLVPLGRMSRLTTAVVGDLLGEATGFANRRGDGPGALLYQVFGEAGQADLLYVVGYIVVAFGIGWLILERRDL